MNALFCFEWDAYRLQKNIPKIENRLEQEYLPERIIVVSFVE